MLESVAHSLQRSSTNSNPINVKLESESTTTSIKLENPQERDTFGMESYLKDLFLLAATFMYSM